MSRPRRVAPTGPPKGLDICAEFRRLGLQNPSSKVPASFLTDQRVPECFEALRSDRLPENFEPSTDSPCRLNLSSVEIDNINAAFDALALFQPLTDKVERSNKTLHSLMLDTWKNGAWKWLLFFYNAGSDLNDTIANSDRPKFTLFSKSTCFLTLTLVLKGVTVSTPLCKELLKCHEMLEVMGCLWVDNPSLEPLPLPHHFVHEELTVAIQNIELDDNTPREDKSSGQSIVFAAAVGHKGAKAVMKAATKNLERLIDPSVRRLNVEELHKEAFLLASLGKTPSLCEAMHEVGTLTVVGQAIGALAEAKRTRSRIVDERDGVLAHKAVEMLAGLILIEYLYKGDDMSALAEAAKAGLVKHLWMARVEFGKFTGCKTAVNHVIREIIGPSLIFRSVLHAVEEDINKSGFLQDLRNLRPKTDEDWFAFYEQYADLLIYRDEIDEAEQHMRCANPDCKTRKLSEPVKLKRCSKCEYTRYCSDECQKKDWLEHKKTCSNEDLFNDIQSVSDRNFARSAAEWEARKRIDYISRYVPRNEDLDYLVVVDFTTMRRFLKIGGTPARSQSDGKGPRKRWIGIVAKVQYGKKVVESLGAVCPWDEIVEMALEDRMSEGFWVKTDDAQLPKSMAREKAATGALVPVTGGGEGEKKKKKKKNKKKKKGSAATAPGTEEAENEVE